MRVLFWGTPDFATPALRALLGEGIDVVGVVTQPDKPQGRSRSTLVPPPVKVVASDEELLVLQPEKPRGEAFVSAVRELAPDLSVVVAYGHILPRDVIELPPLGTLNIHASLLPRWRGAAPIQAAILAGDTETGVSIMRMVPALDAGPVILQAGTEILDDETGGELTLRLSARRRMRPGSRMPASLGGNTRRSTGRARPSMYRASSARSIRSPAPTAGCATTT